MVTADEYARWARDAAGDGDDRAEREREFAAVYLDPRPDARRAGRARLRRPRAARRTRCCATSRTCARGPRRAAATCSSTTSQDLEHAATRLVLAAGAERRAALTATGDDDQAIRRLARRGGEEPARPRRRACPGVRTVRLEQSLRCPERVVRGRRRGRRGRSPTGSPSALDGARRAATCASGAARTSAPRRRRVAAEVERLVRARASPPERDRGARALGAQRGPGGGRGARGARGAATASSARPRSSSAPRSATCSRGCGCSSTPPTPARSCARWRARRSSCARSTSRAACRSRGGASSTWSARSSPRPSRRSSRPRRASGSSAFLKLHRAAAARARHDAARPVRPPAHRPPRAAPPAAVRRPGRRRRAARARWRGSASWPTAYVRRSPQATPREFARSSPRSPRPACATRTTAPTASDAARRRGVRRCWRCTRRAGLRVRPRLRARAAVVADAGRAAAARWSRSPTRCSTRRCRPTPRDAHVDEMRRLLHVAMTRARERPRARLRGAQRRAARCSRRRRSPRRRARRSAPSGRTASEELFGPDETLHATYQALRDELLHEHPAHRQRGSASCASTPTSTSPTASCATSSCSSSPRCMDRAAGPVGRRRAARHQRRDPAARRRPSSARSSRRARSTTLLLDAERDAARARRRDRRPRRAVARAVPAHAAATACCSAPRTSRPTGRAR